MEIINKILSWFLDVINKIVDWFYTDLVVSILFTSLVIVVLVLLVLILVLFAKHRKLIKVIREHLGTKTDLKVTDYTLEEVDKKVEPEFQDVVPESKSEPVALEPEITPEKFNSLTTADNVPSDPSLTTVPNAVKSEESELEDTSPLNLYSLKTIQKLSAILNAKIGETKRENIDACLITLRHDDTHKKYMLVDALKLLRIPFLSNLKKAELKNFLIEELKKF